MKNLKIFSRYWTAELNEEQTNQLAGMYDDELAAIEAKRLFRECNKYKKALKLISKNYVFEGELSDCPGCDYDGHFQLKHDKECVYSLAKIALGKR